MTEDQAAACGPARMIYRSSWLKGVRFEYRPLTATPPDKTVGLLYRRKGEIYEQAGVCVFRDGGWLDAKRKPIDGDCLWTALVDD